MTNAISVAEAPGSGGIARRSQVLLLDATGELVNSFDANMPYLLERGTD